MGDDQEKRTVSGYDDTGQPDNVEVSTSGMLAGNLTAGNSASGIMTGMVGGGPASGVAANIADGEDPAQDSQLNLDALDALDGFGNRPTATGDDGVSPQQSEHEAQEMNG